MDPNATPPGLPPTPPPTPPVETEPALATSPTPSPLKQIRTFEGDIAEALGQSKASLVTVRKAELDRQKAREILAPAIKQERLRKQYTIPAAPHKEASGRQKTLLLAIGTLVLLGLAGGGVWYAYTTYQAKTALPEISRPANHFIVTEETKVLDAGILNRDTFIIALAAQENAATTTEAVTLDLRLGHSVISPILSAQDFLTLIQAHAPPALIRSFDPFFMLGILGSDLVQNSNSTHTFLLIKLDSFEQAFPGMLAWEKTLPEDLLTVITPQGRVPYFGSSTPFFTDITIKNKDARVLKDATGKTVLLYSFFNNNMLIITDNEDTLRVLINRLTAESVVR